MRSFVGLAYPETGHHVDDLHPYRHAFAIPFGPRILAIGRRGRGVRTIKGVGCEFGV